ncbi:hypothetical protein IW140_001190 [Coemansia sp. RSA 1813]|nr:hypothetical protein EV178_001220 [Coemansia sp. RSA 1646]KAJ1772124.1 hypothetical protein LPJ74_001709 [Coemansia sp. RSA 1843]KAJ2091757.1 hypothetical protein IW138_001740 [Coemansia sp. RSA 986]KAJ2216839.1 hypothetical protein EV179_000873 [Coemansia sp. RSA 487]KAJ2571841.1 hypothetical protein IW140_001190 [Coemansia sp. RSA 1813]
MSASFSAARFVRRLLKQHTRSSYSLIEGLAVRVRRVARLGIAPLFYANVDDQHDIRDSPLSSASRLSVADEKIRLNSQIPVKPVYIAPRNPVVLCHGLYGFDVRGPEKLPLLQVHYWRGIREALEKVGTKVVIAKVSGTGGVSERARQLDSLLSSKLPAEKVNIIGHSMGGLDARYLITHIEPKAYSVGSLTTVCTPHRGSPFMDWCRDYLSLGYRVDPDQLIRDFATLWKSPAGSAGDIADAAAMPESILKERISEVINHAVGKDSGTSAGQTASDDQVPGYSVSIDPSDARLQHFAQFLTDLLQENASVGESSQLTKLARKSEAEHDYLDRSILLLRMMYRRIMATVDTPAYACLTTDYCKRFFNPATPNVPGVDYLSIGAYMDPSDMSDKINPLIIPHDIIRKAEGPNDGFVSLTSAQWGHYLGSVCADHFDFTNRWRVTSLGRDFISTLTHWSGKWSAWVKRNDDNAEKYHASKNSTSAPLILGSNDTTANSAPSCTETGGALHDMLFNNSDSRRRLDPIDFYLKVGTILYQRGF